MAEKTKRKKAFSFRLSREKLKEFRGISSEDKLNWLEDANSFINEFLTKEKIRKWEKIRI